MAVIACTVHYVSTLYLGNYQYDLDKSERPEVPFIVTQAVSVWGGGVFHSVPFKG